MKVSKWVEHSSEIEIDLGMEDIRAAIAEALLSGRPHDINGSLNTVGVFLRAFTDEQILALSPKVREIVRIFLSEAALRFSA